MKKQTAGREQLGEFAPQFAALNDDVLFGEVWAKEEELSAHDRSMITCSALLAMGAPQRSTFENRQRKWRDKRRNQRVDHPFSLLCWLAKSLECFFNGEGNF